MRLFEVVNLLKVESILLSLSLYFQGNTYPWFYNTHFYIIRIYILTKNGC